MAHSETTNGLNGYRWGIAVAPMITLTGALVPLLLARTGAVTQPGVETLADVMPAPREGGAGMSPAPLPPRNLRGGRDQKRR